MMPIGTSNAFTTPAESNDNHTPRRVGRESSVQRQNGEQKRQNIETACVAITRDPL